MNGLTNTDRASLRRDIINVGLENNDKAETIDKVLRSFGFSEPYNPLKEEGFSHARKRLWPSMEEVGKDAATFGGMLVGPAMGSIDNAWETPGIINKGKSLGKDFVNWVKDPGVQRILGGAGIGATVGSVFGPLGLIPGAAVGGVLGWQGKDDFINNMLQTYNTNLDEIKAGTVDPRDLIIGAQHNPAYALIDHMSVPGVTKLYGSVIKNASPKVAKHMPLSVRQLFPDENQRKFNRQITDSVGNAKATVGRNYSPYALLEGDMGLNREELARHITTSKSNLPKDKIPIADALINSLRNNEKTAFELGLLDPAKSKAEAVAQYLTKTVPSDYNLTHRDFRNLITKAEPIDDFVATTIRDNNLMPEINRLIGEGSSLYDNGKISYLTHKFAPTRDPSGRIIASDINRGNKNYFDVTREIGRATPAELATNLDEAIKFQLDQVSYAKEFETIIDDILHNTEAGKSLTEAQIKEIKEAGLKQASSYIQKGELPNLMDSLQKTRISEYLDPLQYKSLQNVFQKPLNTGIRRVINAFKKNVLATAHWVALNRAGNWTNNFMDGVSLADYIDALKYRKLTPDRLRQQTSFSSYINEGLDTASDVANGAKRSAGSTWSVPMNKLKRDFIKLTKSEGGFEDIGKFASSLYSNTNDLFANPVFRSEAFLELTDRYANIVKQAKKIAKERKVPLKNVLEELQTNQKLFNELNTNTNKALGDYVGRNYALPAKLYGVLGETAPFYRFYTQTGRTTAHQLANHPLKFQSIVQVPNKTGRRNREDIERLFMINPEWYQGGIPYGVGTDYIQTMSMEPLPIQTVMALAGQMGQTGDVRQILSPFFTSIPNALSFQKFDRQATTPRKDALADLGEDVSKFKPNADERRRYFINSILSSTSALYNQVQRGIPEALAPLPFSSGIRSRYDTHPFTEIPTSYNRKLPSETWFHKVGVKTGTNFVNRPTTLKKIKRDNKKRQWNIKNRQQKKDKMNQPLIRKRSK